MSNWHRQWSSTQYSTCLVLLVTIVAIWHCCCILFWCILSHLCVVWHSISCTCAPPGTECRKNILHAFLCRIRGIVVQLLLCCDTLLINQWERTLMRTWVLDSSKSHYIIALCRWLILFNLLVRFLNCSACSIHL